jgi:hypothetical protein
MGKRRKATDNNEWTPGRLVRCPCCNNEYETDDRVPFTPHEWAVYFTAKELFAACEVALIYLEDGAPKSAADRLRSVVEKVGTGA